MSVMRVLALLISTVVHILLGAPALSRQCCIESAAISQVLLKLTLCYRICIRGEGWVVVQAFTAEQESPLLLQHEFHLVQTAPAPPDMDNFSLKANNITREVVAVMEIEDGAVLEMVIKLPSSSPLRRAEVACRRRVCPFVMNCIMLPLYSQILLGGSEVNSSEVFGLAAKWMFLRVSVKVSHTWHLAWQLLEQLTARECGLINMIWYAGWCYRGQTAQMVVVSDSLLGQSEWQCCRSHCSLAAQCAEGV